MLPQNLIGGVGDGMKAGAPNAVNSQEGVLMIALPCYRH
jgi:hypothetical protein